MPDEGAKDWDYIWDQEEIVPVVPFPLGPTFSPPFAIYEGVFTDHLPALSKLRHDDRAMFLVELVGDVLQDANDEHWGFDLRGLYQWPQIIRYEPDKQYPPYGWHSDYNDEDRSKLGMSVCIANAERSAGWMEIHMHGTVSLSPGDVVVFPGYMAHRVPVVMAGERVAMAAWAGGPPWL